MNGFSGTLTGQQVADIQAGQARWMDVGLSTARCDRQLAAAAVDAAYVAAGLEPAPLKIWMDSPLGGVFASAVIRHHLAPDQLGGQLRGQLWDQLGGQLGGQLWDQLRDQLGGQLGGQLGDQLGDQLRGQLGDQLWDQLGGQLGDQLWDQLGGQLGGQLWDQLRGQLGGQLGDQLGDQLRGQLGDQLWDQLGGQLGDQLWDQLGGQLRGQLWDQLRGQLRGQLGDQLGDQLRGQLGDQLGDQLRGQLDPWWEAYWLEFYAQALKVAGQQSPGRLDTLAAAVSELGWWWPMRGAVVMTERPTALNRDQQGRLHGEAGPALAYADDYTGFWWHGVRVPADLVEGDGWDPQRILTERNAEVRRCAAEKLGWDRLKEHLTLVKVAPDPGNTPFRLELYDLPPRLADIYAEPARILICTNGSVERDGTRRIFGIPVPAHHDNPVAAAAELYDMPTAAYEQLEVRR